MMFTKIIASYPTNKTLFVEEFRLLQKVFLINEIESVFLLSVHLEKIKKKIMQSSVHCNAISSSKEIDISRFYASDTGFCLSKKTLFIVKRCEF